MPENKIVTIGEILVEIMATEPGEGFRAPLPLIGPYPSGAPAIFIDQCARLGQPCGIVAAVGDDDFGRLNVARLGADGVDTSAIAVDPHRPTGSAFVRYRPDGGRDFVFNIRHSACAAVALTATAKAMIAGAGHLHVMGSSLFSERLVSLTTYAMDEMRDRGGTVSFDPNVRPELMAAPGMRAALEGVLARTDLFLPGGDELALFAGDADEPAAIRDLLARGVRAVVVKRGAAGAGYFDPDTAIDLPAFAVEEVDPTGAGDCFGATFVTWWLRGSPPAEALRAATAAGALAVGARGPMEGVSGMAEIDAFLARHGGSAA